MTDVDHSFFPLSRELEEPFEKSVSVHAIRSFQALKNHYVVASLSNEVKRQHVQGMFLKNVIAHLRRKNAYLERELEFSILLIKFVRMAWELE
jgi:hypothetical protein